VCGIYWRAHCAALLQIHHRDVSISPHRLARTLGLWFGAVILANTARAQSPLEVVHAFPVTAGNPVSLVQDTDGGLTAVVAAPATNMSPIFKWTSDGKIAFLQAFPTALLNNPVLSFRSDEGDFLGTAILRAASPQQSVIFRMTATGETSIVHAFPVGPYGSSASLLLHASDGNVYGSVRRSGCDQIFRLTRDGTVTELSGSAPTTSVCLSGYVTALVLSSDGSLYGAMVYGYPALPAHAGGIFRIDPSTGDLAWLHIFTGQLLKPGDLGNPYGFVQAADGNF